MPQNYNSSAAALKHNERQRNCAQHLPTTRIASLNVQDLSIFHKCRTSQYKGLQHYLKKFGPRTSKYALIFQVVKKTQLERAIELIKGKEKWNKSHLRYWVKSFPFIHSLSSLSCKKWLKNLGKILQYSLCFIKNSVLFICF